MKHATKLATFSAVIVSLGVLTGCAQSDTTTQDRTQNRDRTQQSQTTQDMDQNNNGGGIGQGEHVDISSIEKSDLTTSEIADIVHMREEEKLARDVYMTLSEKWGQNVFVNIAESEQTHMDEMALLIERYDITDPVTDDTVGVFTSQELQTLYNDLVAQGEGSLLDALIVGATIEDLDIKDLQEAIAATDNEDSIAIYQNLMNGSERHLQSFVQNIEKNNGTYTPQYITTDEYESILAQDRVTGGKSTGNGIGVGAGSGNGAGDGSGAGIHRTQ